MIYSTHLIIHSALNLIQREGDGRVIIQEERMRGSRLIVMHQLLHFAQNIMTHCLCAVSVIPIHSTDAIQLLHTEIGAQITGDLL